MISTNPFSLRGENVPIDNDYDDVYLHKLQNIGCTKLLYTHERSRVCEENLDRSLKIT
jgi:hypothetical protein